MRRHALLGTALLLVAAVPALGHQPGGMPHTNPDNLLPVTKGVYRLPFPAGTDVRVNGDHISHNPHNRIDMSPPGVGTFNVVAAGDGWIEYIQDGFDLSCPSASTTNPNPCSGYSGPASSCCVSGTAGCNCRNNYVFIRHANGEWTKYTHFRVGSVTALGHFVGEFVTSGTVLGVEGDVGFATGVHLHFEVGVPDFVDASLPPTDPAYDPLGIDPANCSVCGFPAVPDDDALLLDPSANRQNRIPVFCQLGFLSAGETYTAVACDGLCGVDDATLSGTVADDDIDYFQATDTLDATNRTIEAGAGAAMRAGTRVRLLPGFHAEEGSFFNASIGPCDSPGN